METLVLNAAGELEAIVVKLEVSGDREVLVPIGRFTALQQGDDTDLATTFSAAELAALPVWGGAAASR